MAGVDRGSGPGEEPVGVTGNDGTAAPVSMTERVPPALVFRWAAAGTAGALITLLVAYGVYMVRGILVLVLIALFVAVSLDPAVRWLVARGARRSWAIAIVVVALVALLGVFIWSIVPPAIKQGSSLLADLPGYLQRLSAQSQAIREITDQYNVTDQLTSLVAGLPARLAGGAFGWAQRFLGVLASSLTVLVLAIYFMADMPRLQRGVVRLFPRRQRGRVTESVGVVADKVGDYMIGNVIISLLAGASTFVCLELVGVPFALPLAVIVALADLIPMIGATLGAVVCVLVSLIATGIWPETVIVLIFFVVYQQVENYLIVPRVMRNTVSMSPVAVLLVALVGGALLGLVGALMAIPIAAAVKVLMSPMVAKLDGPSQPDDANPDLFEETGTGA